jgi:hypothetical protein
MENISTGSAVLDTMDTYKLALPSSLILNALHTSITFCSTSSRPVAFPGLSKDNCKELLRLLTAAIFTNLRACASPENFLARTDNAQKKTSSSEKDEQKVILVGASILKYSSAYFNHEEMTLVDHFPPGWTGSAANIGRNKFRKICVMEPVLSFLTFLLIRRTGSSNLMAQPRYRTKAMDGSTLAGK